MAVKSTIVTFVEEAVARLQEQDRMRLPITIPVEMQDDTVKPRKNWVRWKIIPGTAKPRENWAGWKIIPSTATDQDLDELERSIGLHFPPPYREFLRTYHFYDLTDYGVEFCRHPIHMWKSELVDLYRGYHEPHYTDWAYTVWT